MSVTFEEQIKRIRRARVPLVAIETEDQQETVRKINAISKLAIIQWDKARGVVNVNEAGVKVVQGITQGKPARLATSNPAEFLDKVYELNKTIVIMHNAHKYLVDPGVMQAVANLREKYKEEDSACTLIMLAPTWQLPPEIKQDVVVMEDPLPTVSEIEDIAKNICDVVQIQNVADMDKISDTLIGLSAFSAEQTLATCIFLSDGDKPDIDRKALWERKCKAIEQTPGLHIWKGGEMFDDIGGCENIKTFMRKLLQRKRRPRAVIFIDEVEKSLAGVSGDTSGVSQDQLGVLLSFMQDNNSEGIICIGPAGAAKSAMAKAVGNEGNIPTIALDFGEMKNALVGKSGEQTRNALKIIQSISQGRTLFIATCNSITALPPELRRRFTMGTFFFDLPNAKERDLIWKIYEKKYEVSGDRPNDDGWTGAEIRQCCFLASEIGVSLQEAADYIVPVSVSAKETIDRLRDEASGKFINAGARGMYVKVVAPPPRAAGKRTIDLKDRNIN